MVTVGRFAPSPTGPLHMGSMVAAVGSYLFARASGGRWHVRVDDLDPPREVEGAASEQLRALEAYGLHWDGEVVYQSQHTTAYREALQRLEDSGMVFSCGCSRGEIAAQSGVYPGTCRNGLPDGRRGRSIRVRVQEAPIRFTDLLLGHQRHPLAEICGDFVIRRGDGLFAYQLAVVADDIAAGITQVVRGGDLLNSTGRQIYLYQLLGEAPPEHAHLPLVVTSTGHKISKSTGATPVSITTPEKELALHTVLDALGQAADGIEATAPVEMQLAAAVSGFDPDRIPRRPLLQPAETAAVDYAAQGMS